MKDLQPSKAKDIMNMSKKLTGATLTGEAYPPGQAPYAEQWPAGHPLPDGSDKVAVDPNTNRIILDLATMTLGEKIPTGAFVHGDGPGANHDDAMEAPIVEDEWFDEDDDDIDDIDEDEYDQFLRMHRRAKQEEG